MKNILFLCVGNSCRSQMAEGFARASGNVIVASAGTEPGDKVAPKAIEVMKEKGIDISDQHPKLITADMVENAEICISMGCGVEESCPVPLLERFIDWGLEDPWGQSLDKYRETRDEIEKRVRKLLQE